MAKAQFFVEMSVGMVEVKVIILSPRCIEFWWCSVVAGWLFLSEVLRVVVTSRKRLTSGDLEKTRDALHSARQEGRRFNESLAELNTIQNR